MKKIPKIIHYCWFGNNKKPLIVEKCIKSWKEKLPDYQLIEWNESNFDINMSDFTKNSYDAKKWAFVSDYCRLWVLFNYGGIYLDTDMEILKSLDEFLIEESFTGTEDNKHISVGIWGCKKNDEFIKEVLEFYDSLNFNEFKNDLFSLAIPIKVTEIAEKKGYTVPLHNVSYFANNVAVYPKEFFYPKEHSWEEAKITKNTYSIHHYEGSWRSPFQIIRSKIKNKIMNIIRKIKV